PCTDATAPDCLYCTGARLDIHSFPTRRSSDLENNPISEDNYEKLRKRTVLLVLAYLTITVVMAKCIGNIPYLLFVAVVFETISLDRKSTRLNSSHVSISYAVFCLKKKMQKNHV